MVSLITALAIQEHGADVATGQGDNGQYGFEIYSIIREKYRTHLTSQPIYQSPEIAKKEGEQFLKEIQAIDLSEKRKTLQSLLGEEESKIVGDITSATQ